MRVRKIASCRGRRSQSVPVCSPRSYVEGGVGRLQLVMPFLACLLMCGLSCSSRSELPSARLTGSAGSAVAEALPNGVDKNRWDELAAKRPYSSRGSLAVQSLCSASFARHLLGLFSVWCARCLAGLKSGPRADTVFWPSRIQFIDRLSGRAGGDGRQLQSAPAFQSLDSPFALHTSSSPEFASSIRRQLR